jgi:hypothetical protein
MMLARLDNGVYASYQQCHYTPDYWRNYTVIGDEGRLENFGDGLEGDPAVVKVWNARRSGYRADADISLEIAPETEERHGGADQHLVAEFLRFAAEGGPTETSPLAAREAVAAGVAATISLRSGGRPVAVPELGPGLVGYFAAHQAAHARPQSAGHEIPGPGSAWPWSAAAPRGSWRRPTPRCASRPATG